MRVLVMREDLSAQLHELICRASSDLPADVEAALSRACAGELAGDNGRRALESILKNIALARRDGLPLCQDTGTLLFWVEAPPGFSRGGFETALRTAVGRATAEGVLRQNCVDSLTGASVPGNCGSGSPKLHWREGEAGRLRISLILKGGGCENVGRQYALPDSELGAGRDLEGVRRCCLDAVWRAQGMGCAPGVLGVCIGGDRATGYEESKRQFLRELGNRSPEADLARLEERFLREANRLSIGPMGFGGKTTLLDVLIGRLDRLPASYFVSVSYMCWAFRRQSVELVVKADSLALADALPANNGRPR